MLGVAESAVSSANPSGQFLRVFPSEIIVSSSRASLASVEPHHRESPVRARLPPIDGCRILCAFRSANSGSARHELPLLRLRPRRPALGLALSLQPRLLCG